MNSVKSLPSKTVALPFHSAMPHYARTLKGIIRYVRENTRWRLVTAPEIELMSFEHLEGWKGDGVIGAVITQDDLNIARSLNCPVVNISGALAATGLPQVRVDYRAAGAKAADHLLGCQFKRFAFCGIQGVWFAQQHKEGFLKRLEAFGFEATVMETDYPYGAPQPWEEYLTRLESWLEQLTPPVGLYCLRDVRAITAIEACHRVGLRVPQDVAVIGFDNDETSCEFCDPPLTSIARNDELLGYEAARLLDKMMQQGMQGNPEDIILPVGDVVPRESTSTAAVDDPHLMKAIEYIHRSFGRCIGSDEIAQAAGRSRRWLENQFKVTLKCSPKDYLDRLRMQRVMRLLSYRRDLNATQVSRESGFSGPKHLARVFRRWQGESLSTYISRLDQEHRRREGADPLRSSQ